jgi:hypothetical protein
MSMTDLDNFRAKKLESDPFPYLQPFRQHKKPPHRGGFIMSRARERKAV